MWQCFSDRIEEEAGKSKKRSPPEDIIGKLREAFVSIGKGKALIVN
jgi:hypothetical protein